MVKCDQICPWNYYEIGCKKPNDELCPMSNLAIKEKTQTNADRIRAMSDEELAVFLERSTGGCETCAVDCTCNGPEDLPAKTVCHQGVLRWLQSPAEKEGE